MLSNDLIAFRISRPERSHPAGSQAMSIVSPEMLPPGRGRSTSLTGTDAGQNHGPRRGRPEFQEEKSALTIPEGKQPCGLGGGWTRTCPRRRSSIVARPSSGRQRHVADPDLKLSGVIRLSSD